MNPDELRIRDLLETELGFFKEDDLKSVIAQHGKLFKLDPGLQVLSTGQYVKTVPIVLSGMIKVSREEQGKEMLLYYINPGESCIMSIQCGINETTSQISATTEDETEVLLIPSRLVEEWQRSYGSFNKFILDLYSKRFENVIAAFNALAFQSLDSRILAHLSAKVKALGTSKIQITHQELAEELGAARETVSRILKKLEQDGMVKLSRGAIEVIN